MLLDGAAPRILDMSNAGDGWRELTVEAKAGTRYRYRVNHELDVPDPASRHNPEDVHGASEVIDPGRFDWADEAWRGRPWSEAAIYELHVGTFSPEGTFAGIERRLDYLAKLGVTAIELMPIAEFPGKRNWGYDGVLQFAPESSYGRPEELKRLIAAAHARGLMVMLDVVYNHFGPEGNYLHAYAAPFFTERHHTDWGAAINFDGTNARTVRDFFIHNALYWLEEFHFDGLRFDAVHAIIDDSARHILVELAQAVRTGPGAARQIHLVLENDRNQARYLEYRDGEPLLYDAQWNDDEHHAFHVLLTGEKDGYYADYASESAKVLGRCLTEGFGYQGEPSPYRDGQPRGEPSAHLPLLAFVTSLQNHDQIGNRAFGERLTALAPPARLKAAITAWLLAPSPPMLFMGEEFGAASPFLFFCDFGPDLATAITEGRRREFARFTRFAGSDPAATIPDPNHPATFERSKLDWLSLARPEHESWHELYTKLLALRRKHIVPRLHGLKGHSGRYDAISDSALQAQW
ncbi:MAG TPA: malto-oligosyltrehalose trehalohydrolase, partial [Burkholderiales bacterium]|nr:malto-oligosyltrehalose trehalohydrolase [Burkholderiales bacterium]